MIISKVLKILRKEKSPARKRTGLGCPTEVGGLVIVFCSWGESLGFCAPSPLGD